MTPTKTRNNLNLFGKYIYNHIVNIIAHNKLLDRYPMIIWEELPENLQQQLITLITTFVLFNSEEGKQNPLQLDRPLKGLNSGIY